MLTNTFRPFFPAIIRPSSPARSRPSFFPAALFVFQVALHGRSFCCFRCFFYNSSRRTRASTYCGSDVVAILVSTVRLTIHPSSLVQALVARGSFLWFTRCYARCYCCFLVDSHSSRRLSCTDSTRYVSASRMFGNLFVCRFWLSLTLRSIFLFHLRQPSSPGTCATTWRFARSVLFCSGSHFLARALPFNPRKPTRCVALWHHR